MNTRHIISWVIASPPRSRETEREKRDRFVPWVLAISYLHARRPPYTILYIRFGTQEYDGPNASNLSLSLFLCCCSSACVYVISRCLSRDKDIYLLNPLSWHFCAGNYSIYAVLVSFFASMGFAEREREITIHATVDLWGNHYCKTADDYRDNRDDWNDIAAIGKISRSCYCWLRFSLILIAILGVNIII